MIPRLFVVVFATAVAVLIGLAANAQQGGPPPAVLVQPAELRSMTKQAEFVGRAEALEKVDLRARCAGFPRSPPVQGRRRRQRGPGRLYDRKGAVRSRGRPAQGAARLSAGDARQRRSAIGAHRRTHPQRQCAGRPARPAHRRAGSGQSRRHGGRGEPPRRADSALIHRDQDARSAAGSDAPPSRPAIWSGRIRVCSRQWSKTTRCRCSFR